jgi:hypothetical protein
MRPAPVAYVFFNRPEVTRRTFAAVRAARPEKLFLIADGARNRPGEAERCAETRRIVESMIDWPCEIVREYSDTNLGCGRRLATGLTRGFETFGELIVVEDDVLPQPEFFSFCTEKLAQYRSNPRVHAVGGFNPIGRYAVGSDHVGSVYCCPWGWASWQRSWKDYTFEMSGWTDPAVRKRIQRFVANDLIYQWYAHHFDDVVNGKVDTWDFQWMYTMLAHERFTVVSSSNLIHNLGFATDATHTTELPPFVPGLRTYPQESAARAPRLSGPDRAHDKIYSEIMMTASRRKIALLRMLCRLPMTVSWMARRKLAA